MLTPPSRKKHDGQLLQTLSADVRGEETGQPGGAEGGDQRDKAEAQGGVVQEPGAEIQPGAKQVFTQKEEANAALEFIVILGGALKVGYQKHIDAEQPRAHTGEEGHQIPQPRDLPTVRADGRSRRVAISSPRNTTTPPKTVLMIQGREKRSSQVPGTTPATMASSRGRMARQWKLFRLCQVIRPLMTRSGSRLPGVIRVLSSCMASSGAEIRGFPNQ